MRKINLMPILSCIGVAVTSYLVYKKSAEIEHNYIWAKDEKFKNKQHNLDLVKALALPVAAGAATCTCILVHGRITAKEIGALTAGSTLLLNKYKKYREKVHDICGEETARKIDAEIAKDDWEMSPRLPSGSKNETLFYDSFSERFFYAPADRVQQAMYHLNRNLQLRGDATINEFYEFLGLDGIMFGDRMGWDISYFIEILGITPWIDFSCNDLRDGGGEEFVVINFDWEPMTDTEMEKEIDAL